MVIRSQYWSIFLSFHYFFRHERNYNNLRILRVITLKIDNNLACLSMITVSLKIGISIVNDTRYERFRLDQRQFA